MATEDFSFPTTTDTPPRFIESPPLWRSASTSFRHEETERGGPKEEENISAQKTIRFRQRKSFSCIERGVRTLTEDGSEDDDDEEEKMDMLWEDFNEELSPDSDMSPGRMVAFGCVQSLKLSKTGKRPSIVVFMKVLKKLFLLHNSHRTLKKP